ncbi:MAG: L-rhamnose isomerase [Verrucomicrobiota bacterium]
MPAPTVETTYESARACFGELGVDTEVALAELAKFAISMHCWQGDDVTGFESPDSELSGGLAATGNYPGKARTPEELRSDIDQALRLIPGTHRVNLHAIYPDCGGAVPDRHELAPEHFQTWVDWAKQRGLGLDFNGTFFSHPQAADGWTLAHSDADIRKFWIEHGRACRRVGEFMGRELGTPAVVNVWIPDGYKDTPADRYAPRERLRESLDAIFAESLDPSCVRDAVESKLFGIGSESYVAGSHEFYLGYAVANQILLCLDSGHFHPTECLADKVSAVLLWVPEILLHVSRGVRWDSDHVVTLRDELNAIAREIVRGGVRERVHIGLDYFDASINRVAAWVIGMRNTQKALLTALLEPPTLREAEVNGDFTTRLALQEECKTLPFGAVWDMFCERRNVPVGPAWLDEVYNYEREVLAAR